MAMIRKYGKINDWDVSKVTNMSSMFKGATSFNEPLNKWNVSNVTNIWGMFDGAIVSAAVSRQGGLGWF